MMHLLDPSFWHLFQHLGIVPVLGLSLLGLGGGGGGGLALSASASTDASSHISPTVTVNNGGALNTQTMLIIGAAALVGLLILGMIFRGHK